MLEDLLTTTEASELLGVTPGRVRHFVMDGELHGVKRANTWFFTRADIEALKQAREAKKSKQLPLDTDSRG